jgi:hypothetical protein
MLRESLVCLTITALALPSVGCARNKTVVRGQSHDTWTPTHRLRNRVMEKVDPVLERAQRKAEPAMEASKEVSKKALFYTGVAALAGGFLALNWFTGGMLRGGDVSPLPKSSD